MNDIAAGIDIWLVIVDSGGAMQIMDLLNILFAIPVYPPGPNPPLHWHDRLVAPATNGYKDSLVRNGSLSHHIYLSHIRQGKRVLIAPVMLEPGLHGHASGAARMRLTWQCSGILVHRGMVGLGTEAHHMYVQYSHKGTSLNKTLQP